jgi:predicted nucleic acid-binding protein
VIVIDASALVEVLVGRPSEELAVRLSGVDVLHAPHLLDTEVLHVLRRLVGRGLLQASQADEARRHLGALAIDRYPHAPLSDRVWALRENLSTYDATYVALAEALDATLVTADARLAGAPGLTATVELHAR